MQPAQPERPHQNCCGRNCRLNSCTFCLLVGCCCRWSSTLHDNLMQLAGQADANLPQPAPAAAAPAAAPVAAAGAAAGAAGR